MTIRRSHIHQTFLQRMGQAIALLGLLWLALGEPVWALTWSYQEPTDPAHWAEIDPAYKLCATGHTQSPIDLVTAEMGASVGASGDLTLDYGVAPSAVVEPGTTLQVRYPAGNQLTIGGQSYGLQQFHFHVPSEHWIDHRPHAMEIHWVHRSEAGDLAVLAVLVDAGRENPALEQLWRSLTDDTALAAFDGRSLLPHDLAHYRYSGSLTTPPCSEGVQWLVLSQPIQASAAQIARFTARYGPNVRPLQRQ